MSKAIGTLHAIPSAYNTKRILANAALAGIGINVDDKFQFGVTNKSPEFLAKFPVGKVPAFEGNDGLLLVESSAIARYVASLSPNTQLLGSTKTDAALIDQWVAFAEFEIDSRYKVLYGLLRGYVPYFKPADTASRERLFCALDILNKVLLSKTFIVGHRITHADITLACVLSAVFSTVAGKAEREKIPNVVRYFNTVINQPAIKHVFGVPQLAEKAEQYVAPAKPAKEKAAPAPPKEKPVPKPKPAEVDEEDEPSVPEEPKPKNPLDLLPKSTLNLEDWKRAYSNLDTRGPGGSLEWFYDKWDSEGYSIWKVAFKYPEELTQTFMSSNQIGGFFNRLDASRKYLFGSVGVLGTSNNSLIEGVLIARGKDVKPVVEVAPDWESYSFTPIDLNNPAQKSYFEGALAWDLEVDGKKWVDGKNFK